MLSYAYCAVLLSRPAWKGSISDLMRLKTGQTGPVYSEFFSVFSHSVPLIRPLFIPFLPHALLCSGWSGLGWMRAVGWAFEGLVDYFGLS